MTTSLSPMSAHIYMAFPVSLLETRDNVPPITLSVPAETVFPSSLGSIIKQISRVVSYDKSNIVGKNSSGTTVCEGTACIGYSSSNDSITYSMDPLYPPKKTFVSEYKPKIGFVKYISTLMTLPPQNNSTNSTATTIMPLSQNDFAIFRITYNPVVFNTTDKFLQLYTSVVDNQHYLLMLNETKFLENNMGVLKRIQKMFNLSLGTLKPITKSELSKNLQKYTFPPLQTQEYKAPTNTKLKNMLPRTFSPEHLLMLGSLKPNQQLSVNDFRNLGITFPPGQKPSQNQLKQLSQNFMKQFR